MIIAFDAKRMFNNFTGLGNYSRTLIEMLSTYYPENDYHLYTPKIKMCPSTEKLVNDHHTKVILPDGWLSGSLWRTFSMGDLAKVKGAQLFHGLSHELPVGVPSKNFPAIVTMHDVAWRTFPDMYKAWDRKIYDYKARNACMKAQAIIAISEETKRDVCKYYSVAPEKVHVIYQPVGLHYYHAPDAVKARRLLKEKYPDVPERYWLNVGSINQRKNLLGLVKALALIPEDKRLPLVVVGRGGDYKAQVEAYVAQAKLERWVIFETHVNTDDDLRAFYTCAECFAYPSFAEGFGLPIVEAWLCETPVITSNCSCLPEAGGPHAFCVDPHTPEDIAQAYLTLMADEQQRSLRGQQGRQWAAENFSPAVLAKKIMDLYRSVVQQNASE